MSINLLDRFKKLPEQLKDATRQELNQTIDSAKHIADEHAKVANRYEDQADKIEAERQKLEAELKNMGVKQLSPKGIQLRQQINKLKKQEDEKRDLADHYREQQLYERTRMSEAKILQNKKYSHQEKPEYSKQMQQEYYDYLKYDTTAGRMITARKKMENETDPAKRKELKEIYEAREKEHQEYVDGLVYKDGAKPLTKEVSPKKEPTTNPEKPIVTQDKEPSNEFIVKWDKDGNMVDETGKEIIQNKDITKQQLDTTIQQPENKGYEQRKEKLMKRKAEIEANRENGPRLSLFDKSPNIQPEKITPQERNDSMSNPFEDTRDSKILKDKNPTPENIQKYEENRRIWKQYIDDKFKNKDNRDPERDPERDPDYSPDRSPKR